MTDRVRRRALVAPVVFLLASEAIDLACRPAAYLARIEYLVLRAGALATGGVYLVSLGATLLLLVALFSIPRIGRWLVGFATMLLFVINMVFQVTVAHFLNAEDVRVLENADLNAFSGAVFAYWRPIMLPYLAIGLGFIPLAAWLGKHYPVPLSRWTLRGAVLGVAVTAHFFLWDYLYVKCNDFPVEAWTSSLRTLFYAEKERREFLRIARIELPAAPLSQPPADNILLVIDESVRADYVSINNPGIDTTPFLLDLSRREGFVNYGVMVSSTTCSFTAKSLLFTGTTIAPDVDRRAMRNATLFQHARRWGYRTVVLDGPGRNFPNIVIRPADVRQTVDVLMRGYEAGGAVRYYDFALADRARRLIEERPGNFIVLIKVGAHFHYETSYPGDEERYARHLPKLGIHESYGSSRERTINSYKNALRFTVDAFFERLLSTPLPNTTILYTSDHGQSLQEHGQTYTHCKDEIEQAVVPFTLYSDVPWVRAHAWAPGVVLSHHNLYPSLVSLLAREREVEHEGYRSLFSARRAQPRLTYFAGGIWANSRTIEVGAADAIKFAPGGDRSARGSTARPRTGPR